MELIHKIDALIEADHAYIDCESQCYYFLEYPSGNADENRNNPNYSFIHNFKKSVDRKEKPEWKYKIEAIKSTIKLFTDFFSAQDMMRVAEYSFIPIPPSKTKEDALYDSRMADVLYGIKENLPMIDIRDIIYNKNNLNSHLNQRRPSIQEIESNYLIDEDKLFGTRENIIIFDDVLTSGAHFCAAKNKIKKVLPNLNMVIGIFLARRVLPEQVDGLGLHLPW